jgi:hypothetical protein
VNTGRISAVPLVIMVILALVACSHPAPKDQDTADTFLGRSLDDAREDFPAEATVLIQDILPAVELPPTYRDGEGEDRWTVVSACSSSELIAESDLVEVAVIPTSSFTPAVENQMKDGAFTDAVTSCHE